MRKWLNEPSCAAPVALVLAAAVALVAVPAAAHEVEAHAPDTTHEEPQPRPVIEDFEDWPDPYAHERKWGPFEFGGGIGYHAPWQGRGGPLATAHFLVHSPTGRWRVGGELFHREYETRFFDLDNVDIDTYELNLVLHYIFFPGQISPYVGGVLGVHINDLSRREVERKDPNLVFDDDVGAGVGVAALVGIEIPLTPKVWLYSEGRVGLAFQSIGEDDVSGRSDSDEEDTGGASAVIGLRFRF